MRVQDLLRPLLEDFTLFAERVDKEFLSYIEREELYRGIKRAQELKERQQEPLKKAYLKWIEKPFVFLLDRDVEEEGCGGGRPTWVVASNCPTVLDLRTKPPYRRWSLLVMKTW